MLIHPLTHIKLAVLDLKEVNHKIFYLGDVPKSSFSIKLTFILPSVQKSIFTH